MAESQAIKVWEASYYHTNTRKWVYGVLSLTPFYVHFRKHTDENNTFDYDMKIELSSVKCVNKALSSFMYGAIIFTTYDDAIHWFSSLANKNETFVIVQHFLKFQLIKYPKDSMLISQSEDLNVQSRTKLGTQILRSVDDSQKTLEKAGSDLQHQGNQIRSIACTVQDIHQDLSVAERIVSGLSSWIGRWRIPNVYRNEEIQVVSVNDVPDVTDVEALFTHTKENNKCSSKKDCVLRVSECGVTILDLKQKILHHWRWSEVSRVRVFNPWEISISRFNIGKSDESLIIISAKMTDLLEKFDRQVTTKMEYMNPGGSFMSLDNQLCPEENSAWSSSNQQNSTSPVPRVEPSDTHSTHPVSPAEAAHLSSALGRLKSLALDIGSEQDSQLHALDRLTDSVDKAQHKQKTMDNRVKALMK